MLIPRRVLIGILLTLIALGIAITLQNNPVSLATGRQPIESDQLPWCDASRFAQPIDPAKLPPPDVNAEPVCKVRNTVHALPPGRRYEGNSLPGRLSPNAVAAEAYAWAIHILSCVYSGSGCSTSSPGVTQSYFNVSSQQPSLSSGSWSDFHFYNRVHFTHPAYSATCGANTTSTISTGYAYGWVWNATYFGRIITEIADGTNCNVYDSGITISGPGALTMHIYGGSSSWLIDAWLGYWARLNSFNTAWTIAAEVTGGQELWARNGSFSPISVPVNFIHKLEIQGSSNNLKPWSDAVLVAPLAGITRERTESPWSVMDLFGGDFTSMASYK